MGSKRRIAKHLLPIMLQKAKERNIATWVEPFVGGGNMIDKVPDSFTRIGYDLNPHTICAMIDIRDNPEQLPDSLTEDCYKILIGSAPESVSSWVRIACSYGGIFESKLAADKTGKRNYAAEAKRNALKQSPLIQGVEFICDSYENLDFENCLIYCDPPHQDTSGYKTGDFDHDKFFDWCRNQAKKNLVFVSEYNAPNDFKEVWRGEIKTNFASARAKATHNAIEKLFLVE